MLPPIVDSHLHWRDPINNPYETLSDAVGDDGERSGTQAQVYLPENYLGDAGDYEIKAAVHIEAEWDKSDPVGETNWLHHLVDSGGTCGLPIAIVGHADFSNPNIEAVLEAHAARPLTRGIRQILNRVDGNPGLCWADREYLDDPIWRDRYGLLAKYGLGFDLMCFAHQLPAFARLAAQHEDIPVHLEHAALPWDHSPTGRKEWRAGLRILANLPHAQVKISGLGNTILNWTTAAIRDYVLETIDIFSPARVSFASNFPTDKQFSDMPTIWRAFDDITAGFSAPEREAMFQTNAMRSYRITVG